MWNEVSWAESHSLCPTLLCLQTPREQSMLQEEVWAYSGKKKKTKIEM